MNDDLAPSRDFLAGGGEMGALMRAHDWRASPLGAPATWPQRLRSIVNVVLTSRFAMWMAWGPDLTFFYNDAYAPTLGIKHGWALGRPSQDVWSEIWPDIGPRIAHVLQTGEATWDEALQLFLERSGYSEETYHTFSYSPLLDDDETIAGHLCVVSEETERVIGERRLRTLRALAARLAEAGEEAQVLAAVRDTLADNGRDLPCSLTYLWDADGGALRLAAQTGFADDTTAAARFGEQPASRVWQPDMLWAGAPRLDKEWPDGAEPLPRGAWDVPPRRVLVTPIARQGQDRPAGLLVVGLNPHRHLDDAYVDFLGLIAGQIASGLGNARAYEEERRRAAALAELDRAKTDFFSNVSHEFRTPLTLMLNPLEELRGRWRAPEPEHALVDLAHRNALRLLKLVNALLDFSRLEAGRIQASYESVDLAALTADLASTFRSVMEQAGLTLVVQAPPLPQPAYVDRDLWEKIVLNLLSNAFKFTLAGEIAVRVGVSADGRAATLAVSDTGTGIAADELPHLFERFHRVAGMRGRSIEGSGIGLALVRELVHLHGGEVAVSSRPGEGSIFTVTVPFGATHLPPERVAAPGRAAAPQMRADSFVAEAMRWLPAEGGTAAGEEAGEGAGRAGLPARILLADDNADMRGYVERLLHDSGFEVQSVADGAAALDAARASLPDLLLSDVMMPRLDGFGLLAALRADPATRALPIVLLSARAGEDARVEALRAGADGYLVKPFHARELVATLDGNIRLYQLRRQNEERIAGQKRIIEMIATAQPLSAVLDAIARYVEAREPGLVASFLLLAPGGLRMARSRGPSLPDSFHDAIEGLPVEPSFVGTCAEAILQGRAIGVADIAAALGHAPEWRANVLGHGLRAVRSTPIMLADGEAAASLALWWRAPRDPMPQDSTLIDVATHMAAIALERDRSARALRRQTARLRRAQQAGQIAEWSWNIETGESVISGETHAVYGLPPESIPRTGEAFLNRVPEPERAQFVAELAPLLAGEVARYDGEFPFIDGAGRIRWLAARAEVERAGADGRALRVVGVNYDVTARRQIEATLQAVLEAVPVAVWFTHGTDQPRGNRRAAAWLGLPRADATPPADAAVERPPIRILANGVGVEPPLQRAARGVEVRDEVVHIDGADGVRRDLLCSAVPLRDRAGHVIGAVCTGTDITAQIATQRALRELTASLEQRVAEALAGRRVLADIVDGTDVFVQVVDLEYRWLAINRASADEFERIFGARPRPGQSMLDLLADQPEHRAAVQAVWARALAGEEFTEVAEFGDPGRRRRHYEMKFSTLRAADGQRIGAYQFVYDVTERIENAVRLAEAQAQLHEMQKLETVGQLTGGIAHDFNNLLTPIYGALDRLQSRYGQDEQARRMIAGAMQSAERARVLVGRLLSFARRQHLETRPVPVAELVRGMVELIDRSLGPQIEVVLDLPEGLPAARVDPNQLELALLNLCINARDAMPSGGRLHIAAAAVTRAAGPSGGLAPGRYVQLTVADSGIGMDAETLRRAVEPFYTTKGVGKGTGLGLSMVHGLAAQSGGVLLLDSAPGRGTTATILLPGAETEAPDIAAPPTAAQTVPTRHLTILLVDDEDLVRTSMSDMLAGMGHRVIEAATGTAALLKLKARPDIELLLTDHMMPTITGVALVREARRLRPDLPALLMTGFAALDAADADHLPRIGKPFRESGLAAMIAAAVGD